MISKNMNAPWNHNQVYMWKLGICWSILVKNLFIAGLSLTKVGANRMGAPVLWESALPTFEFLMWGKNQDFSY